MPCFRRIAHYDRQFFRHLVISSKIYLFGPEGSQGVNITPADSDNQEKREKTKDCLTKANGQ